MSDPDLSNKTSVPLELPPAAGHPIVSQPQNETSAEPRIPAGIALMLAKGKILAPGQQMVR